MFTGIIEEVGTVTEAGEGTLRIHAPLVLADSKLGDSIAINGVDLTVAEMDDDRQHFFANLMPETYRRSNLGELRPGDRVNLERSVRPNDRLSGHIVRGVVEGVGHALEAQLAQGLDHLMPLHGSLAAGRSARSRRWADGSGPGPGKW